MKYSTYLFDFDGTLVDSMPAYVSVMLRILNENNVGYDRDIVKVITPLGYAGTAEYYNRQLGLKMPVTEVVDLMKKYAYDEYAYNVPAKPKVIETLKRLKELGADLHVLTASPHSVLDVCLKRLGIFDIFTNVWSCDDFGTTKADIEIYNMAAREIGKPVSEILFLDDNYNADKTASAAGMKVCGVYDASSDEYTEEIKSVSHHYIKDFSQLLEL
ncbi:MAG: HAD family hydrolase [Clostridia bacterium]|nr:HAD family hydrolase [Clostridia bacterium]